MPAAYAESSTPIASGTPIQIDLAQLTTLIAGAVLTVFRQVNAIGDPATAGLVANVVNGMTTGFESGLVVTPVNSVADNMIVQLLHQMVDELQNLAVVLGGIPATTLEPLTQ
jgi:hypothetical protein